MNLPIATKIIAGESLLGYVARAADRNGHPHVQHVLGLGGIGLHRASFLCSHPIPDTQRTADFFGCEVADIYCRRRQNLAVEGTTANFIDFFGSPVRSNYCERELRRVSPRSLQISPHHRAAWLLRPLHFCRESSEMLISTCPNAACRKPLKWNYAFGVSWCESCLDEESEPTTDLRDHPGALLDPTAIRPLTFVASLVDPDPNVRQDCRGSLPPALGHIPNWQIFDLAVTLTRIHLRGVTHRQGVQTILTAFQDPGWTKSLAFVGDAVLRWPEGVADLASAMRADASQRNGHFGMFKELGQLARFVQRDGILPSLVAEELKRALVDTYKAAGRDDTRSSYALAEPSSEYIRYVDAVRKYGLDGKKMTRLLNGEHTIGFIRAEGAGRAPVYIKERELQGVLDRARELVRVAHLTTLIGSPPMISAALVRSGHLRLETGPAARLRGLGNQWVHPSEIADFRQRVQIASRPSKSTDVSFLNAVRKCDIRTRQILPLLRDCLDSRMEFSLAGADFDDLTRLQFDLDDLRRWAAAKSWDRLTDAEMPEILTSSDVAMLLGIGETQVVNLLDIGALTEAPYGKMRKIRADSVAVFDKNYVTSKRAAEVFGICPIQIFDFLFDLGLCPVPDFGNHNSILWFRPDFDDLKTAILG